MVKERFNHSIDAKQETLAPLKGYDQGDFIQRNIIVIDRIRVNTQLGPEARYYHAMTEIETHRVQGILDNPEFDQDPYESIPSSPHHCSTRPSTSMTGFIPDPNELVRLVEIDKSLQRMVPESDWETKSIVWSSVQPSGTQTPSSGFSNGTGSRQASRVKLFRGT